MDDMDDDERERRGRELHDFIMSQPGAHEAIVSARKAIAEGRMLRFSADDLRRRAAERAKEP